MQTIAPATVASNSKSYSGPTREKVHFESAGITCAAWHYPGNNQACVVMAAGLGVTKEPGTDLFAKRFNDAGFSVLAFDYRHLGESGGEPRQLAPLGEQLEDWDAAIACAGELAEVDPAKVAIWGFSSSGGHVFTIAARNADVAAAISQTPLADGPAVSPNAMRHQKPLAAIRFSARAILDALGGLVGREPLLVPLAGDPGTVTSLTTPDALRGAEALNPGNRYPEWRQEIAASSAMRVGFYRPGRHAASIDCPLLVVVGDNDGVAPPGPAVRAAERAPRGEVVHLPGGHYGPFMADHVEAVDAQLEFLGRVLVEPAGAPAAVPSPDQS